MIICSVQNVSKSFGSHLLFENLSLEIHDNDRVGLVGRNGTGKTTIFNIIKGKELPDAGVVSVRKDTKIGYLAQIPTAAAGETAEGILRRAFEDLRSIQRKMNDLEAVMAGADRAELERVLIRYGSLQDQFERLGGYEMDSKLSKVADGLQISGLLDQPFCSLSGGEKTKVGLGMILLQEPDLLLLDEPTNHLDIRAVEWLEQFLGEYKGTVIMISHDRHFLDETATKILDLDDGEITVYHSNYTGFTEEKQNRLLLEFQAYQEQQKKIKKMKEAIKRLKEWANQANPPNEGLHKRARNIERAMERMEKLKKPVLDHKKMDLTFNGSDRSGKRTVVIDGVTKRFGDKLLFNNTNLEVLYKDRLAIVGENGSGKSTLIRMILNQEYPDYGSARLGSSVKTGYLAQQMISQNKENETIIQCFRSGISITEDEARHVLAKFLFYGASVFKKMETTSGGEKMRIQLAKLMHQDINLLILDEPTNHLDIESREVLEDAIEHFDGTVLAVSHDRYFLEKLFTKTAWIYNQKLHKFTGGYRYARSKMEDLFLQTELQNERKPSAERPRSAHEIEVELEVLEQEIALLEEIPKAAEKLRQLQSKREKLYEQLLLAE
ncbi:ribosomal protection-like ABC-F family protein [Metabacillus sp. 113a]|uniref:ribosomal protection-like ABC-F family protein n=1 Tax=Metabacillus sp. 113a TaxID=3404706 RepID=UPI003CF2E035